MYLIETLTEDVAEQATMKKPSGPGFTKEEAEQAEKMQVWGTNFSDLGKDFCEFKLLKDGEVFATERVEGY